MNTKPVVKYKLVEGAPEIKVGHQALIHPLNHPNHLDGHYVSNESPVWTSRVQSILSELAGRFETRNTIYELE